MSARDAHWANYRARIYLRISAAGVGAFFLLLLVVTQLLHGDVATATAAIGGVVCGNVIAGSLRCYFQEKRLASEAVEELA